MVLCREVEPFLNQVLQREEEVSVSAVTLFVQGLCPVLPFG